MAYDAIYKRFLQAEKVLTSVNNCPMSPEAEREAAHANWLAAQFAFFSIADAMERHGELVSCETAPKCSITGNFF
jgi:hypothetical protein